MSLNRRILLNTEEYRREANRASDFLRNEIAAHERTLGAVRDRINEYSTVWGIILSLLLCAVLGGYLYVGYRFARTWVNDTMWQLGAGAAALIVLASFINVLLHVIKKIRYGNLRKTTSDLPDKLDFSSSVSELFAEAAQKGYDVPLTAKGALRSRIDRVGRRVENLTRSQMTAWDTVFGIIYFISFAMLSVLAASVFCNAYYYLSTTPFVSGIINGVSELIARITPHLAHVFTPVTDVAVISGAVQTVTGIMADVSYFLSSIIAVALAYLAWRGAEYHASHPVTLTFVIIPLVYPLTLALMPVIMPFVPAGILILAAVGLTGLSETAGKLLSTVLWAALFGAILWITYPYQYFWMWITAAAVMGGMILMLLIDSFTGERGARVMNVFKSIFYYPLGIVLILYITIGLMKNIEMVWMLHIYSVIISVLAAVAQLFFSVLVVRRSRTGVSHLTLLHLVFAAPFMYTVAPVSAILIVLSPCLLGPVYILGECGCRCCENADDRLNGFVNRCFSADNRGNNG